uniref:Uncharacterized protein n=1 Tax=Parastrongyloides trichosuri TaxID=131310 RepID=A0A0N4ZHM9_PARTI
MIFFCKNRLKTKNCYQRKNIIYILKNVNALLIYITEKNLTTLSQNYQDKLQLILRFTIIRMMNIDIKKQKLISSQPITKLLN